MHLLHRGQAPQKPLLLRPLFGGVQRIGMRSESTTTLRDAGRNKPGPVMPGVQMVMAVEVLRVLPDGSARYRFTLEEVDLLVAARTPVRTVESARAQLSPLPGLKGEGQVAPNGRSSGFEWKLPAELSAPVRGQMQQLAGLLKDLGTFLPAEPVGLGARWEQNGAGSGALTGATTRVELRTLEGQSVGLRLQMETPRTPQPVPASLRPPPGTPGETTMHTEARGHGGCMLSLDRLWPVRLELDVESHAAVRAGTKDAPKRFDGFTTTRLQVRELSFTPPRLRAARTV
ncbi:hypothetical protein D7X96_38405 [Corallococcus interemptor]|uniref:Uncharacterized protein n=3 Tax=Corallococcus TaxID=83461 RepID=A0A3A8Q209_9BACT|nr:hypothetical protein [Corallococcus interemptor]RKH38265.1 hypothetical protein D7Y23_38415 [Corallococcus sp. AB050B]RKH57374.1 hypothetical protein D7X96_38405 [Corallococcus interemptor]